MACRTISPASRMDSINMWNNHPDQIDSSNPWWNDSSRTNESQVLETNRSHCDGPPRIENESLTWMDFLYYSYYAVFLFSISVFSIIGNILVIRAMIRNRNLRTPANYYLLSLAVSDLLLGVVYPMYNFSHINSATIRNSLGIWPACSTILALTLGLLCISSYNLVGITVIRYISIRDPLKFPLHLTHRRALIAVIVTWVVLCMCSAAIYIRKIPKNYYGVCRYEIVLGHTDVIITTCFYVIIPLTIMSVLYSHMAIIASKQIRKMVRHQGTFQNRHPGLTPEEIILRREMRMFKMAGSLLGYYTFAWLPFVVFEFYSIFGGNPFISRWIRATVRIMLHSNTAINVLVYAGRLRDFRHAIKNDLRRLRRKVTNDYEYS